MKNIVGKDRMTMKECVDFFGFSRQKIGRLIAKSKLKKLVPPFPFIDLTGSDNEDECEFTAAINYCPMCGKKLTEEK